MNDTRGTTDPQDSNPEFYDSEFKLERLKDIPRLIEGLYEIVDDLEAIFPGRRFTPDGHMVGSIGEVLAAYDFGLELAPASTNSFDAWTFGRELRVEIKATQRGVVGLSSDDRQLPDRLLAFWIPRGASRECVYNGSAERVWQNAGKPQKTGRRSISVATLRGLDLEVPDAERLPRRDK